MARAEGAAIGMLATLAQAPEPVSAEDVAGALRAGEFFWLDLDVGGPAAAAAFAVLRDDFALHPLALEDAEHFGQRPKFDDYDDAGHMVVHGAAAGGGATHEVHLFVAGTYVVTLHRGDCPALDSVHQRITRRHTGIRVHAPQVLVTYLVVDALTDSFFPVLSSFDDQIDDLETSILEEPTEAQLGQIFAMKRQLMGIRRVIGPQRDMFAAISAGVTDLPGMTDDSGRYFRDLYDHLIRIGDMVDGYRDLVSGVMDTHLSTVSNRLNVVMKQLAVIATVFLPLSFLTGFFGQNFSWLVTHLGGMPTFVGVGIGLEALAVVLLLALFKRRGWLGGPSA
ncbi:MAG: magnesium transporter CorA family protein [Acidimicrobiales bacterium]